MQTQIIITPRGRLMGMMPHYLLINNQMIGIVKGGEAHINVSQGMYKITIRSVYRFIESSVNVYVATGETKRVSFSDKDKWWNWLFNIDLVLWIAKRLLHVPEPWGTVYEVVSNGFFGIWLLRLWLIRKRYFAFTVERIEDK